MPKKQAFDHHTQQSHRERREQQRPPVVDPQHLQPDVGRKRTEHVEGPVREVNDPEESKDHRQAKTQERVERTIDQPEHELT